MNRRTRLPKVQDIIKKEDLNSETRSNRADHVTLIFKNIFSMDHGHNGKGIQKNPSLEQRSKGKLERSRFVRRRFRQNEKATMGVGTLIIFIAMVIIAAIAAGIMLYAGSLLRDDARGVLDTTTDSITAGLDVVTIIGDRNENGNDSTMVRARFPKKETKEPLRGSFESVTVTPDGAASPLYMELTWNSGVDLDTGLKEERIYRSEASTLNGSLDALANLNKVLTTSELIATIPYNENDRNQKTYIDYTVGDIRSLYYAYPIVGLDMADNMILYSGINNYNRTDNNTVDQDSTPPNGGTHFILDFELSGTVTLLWSPPSPDAGTALSRQYIYINDSSMENADTYVDSNGRTKINIHEDNTLIAVLNGSASSYYDHPKETGIYHYGIIGEDSSGNQVLYNVGQGITGGIEVSRVDRKNPAGIYNLFYFRNPNSIGLTWSPAADSDTGIGAYNIYRVRNKNDIDTLEKVKHLEPLTTLDENARSYTDYTGLTSVYYYYLVTAVDRAGNIAYPQIPTDRLQVLEFKVRPRSGSDSINMDDVSIDLYDGSEHVSLYYDTVSTNESYTAEAVMDPGENFERYDVLDKGAIVNIKIDLSDVGLTLTLDKEVVMKILLAEAEVCLHTFEIPPMRDDRYILIW